MDTPEHLSDLHGRFPCYSTLETPGVRASGSLVLSFYGTDLMFQVRPGDPEVYLAVAVLLGGVALIAGYFPAHRACKIDPLTAIRQE